MIRIKPSPTADTRTCDWSKVNKIGLLTASIQHIDDLRLALSFFSERLAVAAGRHDFDKLSDLDGFHANFTTGFEKNDWLDRHYSLNRHHLDKTEGIPPDVNLIDVLDFIADCVMAGMARAGTVYPLELPGELLQRAFQNTVEMLKAEVIVEGSGR